MGESESANNDLKTRVVHTVKSAVIRSDQTSVRHTAHRVAFIAVL